MDGGCGMVVWMVGNVVGVGDFVDGGASNKYFPRNIMFVFIN